MPNPNFIAFVVPEVTAFIRMNRHTELRTCLVILINNIYTL